MVLPTPDSLDNSLLWIRRLLRPQNTTSLGFLFSGMLSQLLQVHLFSSLQISLLLALQMSQIAEAVSLSSFIQLNCLRSVYFPDILYWSSENILLEVYPWATQFVCSTPWAATKGFWVCPEIQITEVLSPWVSQTMVQAEQASQKACTRSLWTVNT